MVAAGWVAAMAAVAAETNLTVIKLNRGAGSDEQKAECDGGDSFDGDDDAGSATEWRRQHN